MTQVDLEPTRRPLVAALAVVVGFALLEALLSGGDAATQYASLTLPSFSPPFELWLIIGTGYYVICLTVITRLLRLPGDTRLRLALLVILTRVDRVALIFLPYVAYLAYATVWGYRVWQINLPDG